MGSGDTRERAKQQHRKYWAPSRQGGRAGRGMCWWGSAGGPRAAVLRGSAGGLPVGFGAGGLPWLRRACTRAPRNYTVPQCDTSARLGATCQRTPSPPPLPCRPPFPRVPPGVSGRPWGKPAAIATYTPGYSYSYSYSRVSQDHTWGRRRNHVGQEGVIPTGAPGGVSGDPNEG